MAGGVFNAIRRAMARQAATAQVELDALNQAARELTPKEKLVAAATGRFAFPGREPPPLELYHGSPHKFEQFDFEGNLKRGEGALAFGPGGYLTGSEALARQYAESLYARHAGTARTQEQHAVLKDMIRRDPTAAAEFLRAGTLGKVLASASSQRMRVYPPRGDSDRSMLEEILIKAHHDTLRRNPVAKATQGRIPEEYLIPGKSFVPTLSRLYLENPNRYTAAMSDAGIHRYPGLRVGRGGTDPDEALRMGREIRKAVAAAGDPEPRLYTRLTPLTRDDWNEFDFNGRPVDSAFSYKHYLPILNPNRLNLNSLNRVIAGRPGKTNYMASMHPSGYFDFRKVLQAGDPSDLARSLYRVEPGFGPADLLPYDYPLSTVTPDMMGRLADLAERYGVLEQVSPDLTGRDFMRMVQKQMPQGPLAQMREFKRAGVPGHMFLRGGRRDSLPDEFRPDDFNFVIFDQDRLPPPVREEFSRGGPVRER